MRKRAPGRRGRGRRADEEEGEWDARRRTSGGETRGRVGGKCGEPGGQGPGSGKKMTRNEIAAPKGGAKHKEEGIAALHKMASAVPRDTAGLHLLPSTAGSVWARGGQINVPICFPRCS